MRQIKILFVCYGNICRSPMAEFMFRDIAGRRYLENKFEVASAATSAEESGNPVYPQARRKLAEHGISTDGKRARQLSRSDYEYYDYLIAMEQFNIRCMMRIIKNDPDHKVYRLLDFTDSPGDIADPWYTDDFETAYRDILKGCNALFGKLVREYHLT